MIYFLLLPLWLLAVIAGGGLLVAKVTRRFGAMLVCGSTLALLVSLAASTGMMFAYGGAVQALGAESNGLVFIGGYLLAAVTGGVVGLALGAWLGWRLSRPKRLAA